MIRSAQRCSVLLTTLLVAACLAKVPHPAANVSLGAGTARAALPPDPGPRGRATIAGVDSDGDGARDDVQRFVILGYPDSQRMQAALLQLARGYQAWLAVRPNDAGAAFAASEKTDRAMECLFAVTTLERAYDARIQLKLQMLDTDARQDAFFAADALLSGSVFVGDPDGHTGATCTFKPETLPN
jgi:hypothetical protein